MSYPQPPAPFPPSPTNKSPKALLWVAIIAVPLAVIVAAALVVVLLAGGDDGDKKADDKPTDASSQTSDATSEPTEATSSAAPAGPDNTAVVGEWYGRYRCTQGASAGRLRIEAVPGSTTQVTAVFRFGVSIINENVEAGSYKMTGEVTGSQIKLTAGEWIKQAPGYGTVDFTAPVTSSAPTELYGTVDNPGCQRFRFLKQ